MLVMVRIVIRAPSFSASVAGCLALVFLSPLVHFQSARYVFIFGLFIAWLLESELPENFFCLSIFWTGTMLSHLWSSHQIFSRFGLFSAYVSCFSPGFVHGFCGKYVGHIRNILLTGEGPILPQILREEMETTLCS